MPTRSARIEPLSVVPVVKKNVPSRRGTVSGRMMFRKVFVGTTVQGETFASNAVETSIYTPLNFVPKNLFKQFCRFSNLYFLFITALQLIPEVTSTPGVPTMIVPLAFIIVVSAARDAVEDVDRHRSDKQHNEAPVTMAELSPSPGSSHVGFQLGMSADVHVGEVVRVAQHEEIPADLMLIGSSDKQGQCFVMTANLDGESSLKPRYVPSDLRMSKYTSSFTSDGQLTSLAPDRFRGVTIECEPPSRRIDRFEGILKMPKDDPSESSTSIDLDITHVLLKGTQLRDTEWIIGVAIYTGDDTRVRQNSSTTPIKQSWLYRFINKITLWIVLAQIVILIAAVVEEKRLLSSSSVRDNLYLPDDLKDGDTLDYVWLFLAYMLLFSNFVPISLQVTIDFTRYFQAAVIHNDPNMQVKPDMRISSGSTPRMASMAERASGRFKLSKKRVEPASAVTKHSVVRVQSSELNEELGLVEHMFTDKTGTLTCNRMEFRSCHVDGYTYDFDEEYGRLRRQDELCMESCDSSLANLQSPLLPDNEPWYSSLSPLLQKFLLNLAVNNSISPNHVKTSSHLTQEIEYSGQSPDERTLVEAAARLGIALTRRDNTSVTVRIQDAEETLTILHTFEFTSDRKKSSMLCRRSDGRVVLYCKGADTVILPALSDKNSPGRIQQAREQMNVYCSNGLRVLCIAERELSEEEFTLWHNAYVSFCTDQKSRSRVRRESGVAFDEDADVRAVDAIISKLEKQLTLIGITGIEDKIQDGVPETLEKFRHAGLKVWMLTGDRADTATNVAYSVRLISSDMRLIKLNDSPWFDTKTNASFLIQKELKQILADSASLDASGMNVQKARRRSLTDSFRIKLCRDSQPTTTIIVRPRVGMLINNMTIEAIKQFGIEREFLELCMHCDSVLCARISPKQKEFVVEMVRSEYPGTVTMAVGDGANDVPMIQRAHIGVGIAGEEGHQAADASDYSIPQFRFLQRLVLVHGRGMNRRIAVLTLYIFYKNVLLVLPQFVYGVYCLYSGQSSYYDPLLQLFNICFTSLPVLYFSVGDQDISAETVLRFPRLYQDGSSHAFLNVRVFIYWMFEATVASILVILVPAKLIPLVPWSRLGKDNDLWSLGLAQNFAVVVLANARLLIEMSTDYRIVLLLILVSVASWWALAFVMSSYISFGREFYGILRVGGLTQLWLSTLFTTVLSLLLAFLPRVYDVLINPQPRTICRELDFVASQDTHDQPKGRIRPSPSDNRSPP